ncbi:MAG: heavy metal translocating P-type ATPase [Verrucomicrobiota bacterium]
MNPSSHKPAETPAPPRCLVETVTAAMKDEPALEAVRIDRAKHAISVATLGKPKSNDLDQRLTSEIQEIERSDAAQSCGLLKGAPDCASCPIPQQTIDPGQFSIRHEGDTTTIARVTCPTAPTFWRWHDLLKLVPRKVVEPDREGLETEWKQQLAAAAVCGACGLAGFALNSHPASLALYALAYVAGGLFALHEVLERLRERVLDVHFLMLAVALGSASIGGWAEGATLLFLFSLSGALEHYAMGRTQREIRSLFKTAPKTATLLDAQGNERPIGVDGLAAGMKLRVKPGDQFPVDAEIIKGKTAADESNLTGEATPVDKTVGDTVLAGTINLWGVVDVGVLRPANQSALQKIIQLIKEAQHLKAPAQRFTDQFGTRYTYAILSLSLVMFFVWWLAFGLEPFLSTGETKSAFYRTMTLLVVASPCALVLSIPSAILAAIAWAARHGILFRGGAAVEKLSAVNVVAMDKTGTLTTGELQVERVESFPPGREAEIAQLAYSLERLSTHPLARAVTRYGKQNQIAPVELEDFESVAGTGLKARHGREQLRLGRRDWLATGEHAALVAQVPPAEAGHAEVWLGNGQLVGRVLLRDDIRPQARAVVDELRRLGLRTLVLTGDHQAAADLLQETLGPDEVRAELKPEQKVEAVAAFTKEGRKVAMIGDGVNDAPSLAAADVGVAMGARGSDAALEQAEVVLMHDRLENFLAAFQLSRRAQRIIRQNLALSLGTVAVLVVCALLGTIPLTVGVVGHEGSTVIVVLNSLRLLFGINSQTPARSPAA